MRPGRMRIFMALGIAVFLWVYFTIPQLPGMTPTRASKNAAGTAALPGKNDVDANQELSGRAGGMAENHGADGTDPGTAGSAAGAAGAGTETGGAAVDADRTAAGKPGDRGGDGAAGVAPRGAGTGTGGGGGFDARAAGISDPCIDCGGKGWFSDGRRGTRGCPACEGTGIRRVIARGRSDSAGGAGAIFNPDSTP